MVELSSTKKWPKFIERLVVKTDNGELVWTAINSVDEIRENLLSPVFISEVKGKHIVIYRQWHRHYHDDIDFERSDSVVVEFVDGNLKRLWQIPDVGPRFSLMNAIELKASGAEAVLDAILAEDDDDD